MSKVSLGSVSNLSGNPGSAQTTINDNFQTISEQLDLLVSRDAESPNTMQADLDMNSKEILNLGSPTSAQSAARYADVTSGVVFTGIGTPAQVGNSGRFLGTDGTTASWRGKWPDRTTSEIAAGITPTDYNYAPGDVRRYGVIGDGITDDRVALQNAISSNSYVYFPVVATYIVSDQLNLINNSTLYFTKGAEIKLKTGVIDKYIIRGTAASNVSIIGATITGNGAFGFSSCYLTSCDNILFDNCKITKSGTMAIWAVGCSNLHVRNCDLSRNYGYGVDDRDGTKNSYIGNTFYLNGDTGVATGTGGRGINLWRCVGTRVIGNSFISNTEYGFRLYSEAADGTSNYGNIISGCYFNDNASSDLVLYDESLAGTLVLRNTISDCVAIRSINAPLGASFVLHGGDNTVVNCHVYKTGAFGTFAGFLFYYAFRNSIHNSSVYNTNDALGFSNATDCVVSNFRGRSVATVCGVGGIVGSGNTIRNSEFTHGGGGGSDVGIVHYNSTGKNWIENCRLDGFNIGIYIGTEAVALRNNTTINSGSAGLRKDNNAQAGQELVGNTWDSTNPALIQNLERTNGRAELWYTAAPTIRTWAVGDMTWNTATVAGGTPGWVCTAAGTPGTWKAMANVAA